MRIVVLGLNHKTAPVALRERLAFDAEQCRCALHRFKERFPGGEFAILSTCNRVELYAATQETDGFETQELLNELAACREVRPEDFREHVYVHFDAEAVTHLLTVGASLDSMVVGEPQIFAQVKECYSIAVGAKSTGKILNRLFHHTFATGKEVYSSTNITNRRVSVAGVAVELAKQLFSEMARLRVLVVGAGEMGRLLVQHLRQAGAEDVTVVNRSYERAVRTAEENGISAARWEQMDALLERVDMVITSAAARGALFDKPAFKPIVKRRRQSTLLIIDVAVPRNVAPAVGELEGVYLFSVDDLADVVRQNVTLRENEVDRAVAIIYRKVAEFMEWLEAMRIGPLVGQLKEAFGRIQKNEMERFFVGPRAEASCRQAMEAMVHRVVNRLLHCVIANLNAVAREQGAEQAARLAERIVQTSRQLREGNGRDA